MRERYPYVGVYSDLSVVSRCNINDVRSLCGKFIYYVFNF